MGTFWTAFWGGFWGKIAATIFVAVCLLFGFGPDEWVAFMITGFPEVITPTLARYAFLVLGLIVLIYIFWPLIKYKRPIGDVWVLNAAQYIVTKDWKAEQIVGYGKEIDRLRTEGTTQWGSEFNCTTGEHKHIRKTPEEEALAIRNTRTENVNNALEEIRQKAVNGFPIWSRQDHEKSSELIDKEYWECYGFEKIEDLKKSSLDKGSLKTENKIPPHNKPIYHSLEASKAKVEELWPPENT